MAKDTHRLKVRGQKKIIHANGNDKKAGIAIFVSDKIDIQTKAIKERRALNNDNRINTRSCYSLTYMQST